MTDEDPKSESKEPKADEAADGPGDVAPTDAEATTVRKDSETDEDGWAEASPRADDSDYEWGASEPVAGEPDAEPALDPEPPLDGEPDYAAEAQAWRDDLDASVGVEPRKTKKKKAKKKTKRTGRGIRGDGDDSRISKRAMMIAVGTGIVTVLIAVFVILGYLNSRDYYFVCGTNHITGERGRKFPPWGRSSLSGKEWAPIEIPENARCMSQERDNIDDLEEIFLKALVERAETLLTSGKPENVETAEEQLLQALLLTRKPERDEKRKTIERLRGDVGFRRAEAQIKAAVAHLNGAGDRFDAAAKRRPRLNSNASAWAKFSREMSDEIRRGLLELRDDKPLGPDTRPPFAGLPPAEAVDAGPSPPGTPDAQPGTALPPEADATPAPPDAGLPKGGVLL